MALFDIEKWSINSATIIIGLLTLSFALRYLSGRKLHPSEPTVVQPWIPIIGHLLGMVVHGGRYIKRLGLGFDVDFQRMRGANRQSGCATLKSQS